MMQKSGYSGSSLNWEGGGVKPEVMNTAIYGKNSTVIL